VDFADLFLGGEPDEPPEPPPERHERPEWLGPPFGELGAAVPLGLVLGRSDRGGVAVSHALAFSTGVSFELTAFAGGLKPAEANRVFHEQHAAGAGVDELPDGFLRFGIELPDGQRVSNAGDRRRLFAGAGEPGGAVLVPGGGGGGQSSDTTIAWHHSFWLWPLPAPGRLTLYTEWPIAGLTVAHADVDTAPLLAAAATATRLWSDEPAAGAWTHATSSMRMSGASPREAPEERVDGEGITVRAGDLEAAERALANALRALRGSRR